jgi:hypothetical protein
VAVKAAGVISVTIFAVLLFFTGSAEAEWLSGWLYRRPVAVSNPCGEEITGYQVRVVLDSTFYFSHAQSNGADLRLTAGDGTTLIPFWIEEWNQEDASVSMWVKVPSLPLEGDTLYLYYGDSTAVSASDGHATFIVYDGFESYAAINPGEWMRYESNPLITEGAPGEWDDHGATFASVIWDSTAAEFRMYYHGFSFTGVHQIGLATASSPEGPWTKHPGNPIVTPGPSAWDNQSVRVPMVWKESPDEYHMVYTGVGGGVYQIGYAYSSDGITWTKSAGNPVFNDPTWCHDQTENWGVIRVGAEYLMWYSSFGMREAGIAVSTDLVNWIPYQADPIFSSSGNPNDDRYSQYCPFSFKYEGQYYVLMPSYNGSWNHGRVYLYRSSSPYFPEGDRHLVRVVLMAGPEDHWDDHDNDTPYLFTLDIDRTVFYNDELWCYYSGEAGSDLWQEGLLIESDIAAALADIPLPGTDLFWSTTGTVTMSENPVRQGAWSARHHNIGTGYATRLYGDFAPCSKGIIGAWMLRDSSSNGDFDIYLYQDSTLLGDSVLACVGGLGRDGDFHYWNGDFHNAGIPWSVDTWYLVTIAFDATADSFDLVVYDEDINELVRLEGIAFAHEAAFIDQVMIYSSLKYIGDGYVDDFRLHAWCGSEPVVTIGAEEIDPAVAVPEIGILPAACVLYQNYPNPFNPVTEIRYELPVDGLVSLEIYNTLGQKVATLVHEHQKAGVQIALWNGSDLHGRAAASGIYFYRLVAGQYTETRKMVLLR